MAQTENPVMLVDEGAPQLMPPVLPLPGLDKIPLTIPVESAIDAVKTEAELERENLVRYVKGLSPQILPHIVSHRGFHSTQDALTRPIENTFEAFKTSWRQGMHMCECDVTHSADGVIVFSHDQNFARLAMNVDPLHEANVEDLTFQELRNIRLKDGSSILRLDEVLDWLATPENREVAPSSKLVIEVKRNAETELVVSSLLSMDSVARAVDFIPLIMSFKQEICYSLMKRLPEAIKHIKLPKIMVLTELMKIHGFDYKIQGFKDKSVVFDMNARNAVPIILSNIITSEDGVRLDGIYMQFEDAFLRPSVAQDNLRQLCKETTVGVFFSKIQPDNIYVVQTLEALGVEFINSDIPSAGAFFDQMTLSPL